MTNPFFAVLASPPAEASPVAHVGESDAPEQLAGSELPVRVSGVYLEVSDVAPSAGLPVRGLLGEPAAAELAPGAVSRLPSAWASRTGKWPLACGASIEVFSARPGQASAKVLECDSRRGQACAICPDATRLRSGVSA